MTLIERLIAGGVIAAVTLGAAFALKRATAKLAGRAAADTSVWERIDRCRTPLIAVFLMIVLRLSTNVLVTRHSTRNLVGTVLYLILVLSLGWMASRAAAVLIAVATARLSRSAAHDPRRVQRLHTQLSVVQRIATVLIGLITLILALLNFPATRPLATSLFASASLLSLVVGFAAQHSLGNMIAGLQIAFSDVVRIGDTVVVNGERGEVEEISLTAVVIRLMDHRRLVVPVTDFVNKPFENWTRSHAAFHADAVLRVDVGAPVPRLRAKLQQILETCEYWDGLDWSLAVSEWERDTLVLKASMTAASPGNAGQLSAHVREEMAAFMSREVPESLPRLRLRLDSEQVPAPRSGGVTVG